MVSLFANNHLLQKVWVSLEIKYQTMGINLHFIACPGLVFHGYISMAISGIIALDVAPCAN